MKFHVCAVFDQAMRAYQPPMFVNHPGMAERWFYDEINSTENTTMSRHSDQFELHHLGTFDADFGDFEQPKDLRKILQTGKQVKLTKQ